MGWKPWAALTGLVAMASPIVGLTDAPPQVILATPGGAGGNNGVIDRFTMRFSEAMVPLGDPRAKAPFSVKCPVSGTGRWVDAQTFVHEFSAPLPGGVTCEVTLNDGLASQRGVTLKGASSYKIDTGGPSARAVLPGSYDGEIEEDQVFLVAANVAPNRQSVAASGYCAVDGIGEKISLDVLGPEVAPKLLAELGTDDWSVRNFLEEGGLPQSVPTNANDRAIAYASVVAVKCRRPLPPGRDVSLVWASGIAGKDGRKAGRDQRFDFEVRKEFSARFECSRVNPQAGCNPVRPAYIRFTAPVPLASAKAIRLSFPDGTTLSPNFSKDDENKATISDVKFEKPLPVDTKATISIPTGIKDESGRALTNAARFPLEVKIDAAPPLVKFAAPFGIIEANEGGILPVTVRAVEPELAQRFNKVGGEMLRVDASDGQVAKWLRDLDDADDNDFRTETVKGEEITTNYTGTKSLLNGKGDGLKLALPGKGKDFEVVGIPLKDPGFYVVELTSPTLGRSLLGRNTPRYVAAGALVTNMAVHFKWGRETSLAWVTTLDGAKPVAGADVRVTDSCDGSQLARGTTDRQGRLIIKDGLPEPETYGDCEETSESHPLMISARLGGDFSFTLTRWNDGIRPYDFDLPYGYSEADDIIHTVFDRTLVREGETINMKHILRRPVGSGFEFTGEFAGQLKLTHSGSGTEFELPLAIGRDGIGENSWTVPKGAPQGDYRLQFVQGGETTGSGQSFRVDEFRLPTMKATITGPKAALVRPRTIPLDLFVGYLSGGAAPGLPVSVRTAFSSSNDTPEGWEDWSFGGRPVKEGIFPLNGEGDEPAAPLPLAQTLPATLGQDGTAKTQIDVGQEIEDATAMTVEMDYEDANGETLTAARRISLLPSAIQLGIKTDGWLMRDSDLRLKIAAIDSEGAAARGRPVRIDIYSRDVLSARRRLIGGFYAYDNQMRVTKIGGGCTATTDKQGLAACQLAPGVSGEVTVVATTTDADGNVARAVRSVWLAGADDWWFGGDNGDRMDLIPEAKSYKAGETAKFQVRMPFREATALVTVEREGVLSSFVTELSGKDPVIKVPMPGAYAPDVYVSVLAVRGRVSGFKQWLAETAREWNLPFFNREGGGATALVDLAKPSYRLGVAKVKVGWESHTLGVKVKADKTKYGVRETANIEVQVDEPGGRPAKSAEIAFVAVDEALLQLSPNDSWQLIDAMMGERPLSVLTSTAQTQVVGKRTYGRKAVEAGGGGGDESAVTRDDFRPVLLWRGRVTLDARGKVRIPVELSDSLSAFRLVAIANSGTSLFGTGEATVRTSQDLQLFSGVPPLVRTGDWYGASFTLRNASDKAMTVMATVGITPSVAKGEPLTVTIPAGGAVPVTWNLTAPEGIGKLDWVVEAKSANGKAADRIAVSQEVIPAVPIEVWAATLARVGNGVAIPVAAPTGALPGGFVDVKLSDTLAPPLAGVRAYMGDYPYNCFEQRLSRAIVLGDNGAWTTLAGEIPAYLDGDGLLRYFPIVRIEGSEALTAYVLSITAEAGWAIPEAAKARMMEAMKAVVDGRLKRDTAWGGDARLNRIAALVALARNGASTPAMLGSISLAPADMPTSALTDWITAIDRTKGANTALRVLAERTLRQRIVYEGSRLDLADAQNAPWWMMTSTDEMAIKALLAVLGRPGWADEGPKMMVGTALRQRRGHWDTTPANAWGVIATRRFATLFPANAIMGTTTVTLAGQSLSQAWPMLSDAGPLRLHLPTSSAPLMLTQTGGSGPWAMISVRAAVPLTQPLFAGYRVTKSVTILSQKTKDQLTRGDVLKIRITVEAGAERNWVVVNDPVPPGATIIGNLGGQSTILGGSASDGEGVQPSYVERGKDAWRGYFEWVPRGRFVTEYAMRLNGSGQFSLPPTRVEAMYSPDIRAQLPNAPMKVAIR
jgi:alpha-2-macroglobulin